MRTLIAHRGMSSIAPENTLSSVLLCKEYGINWFECDIDILQDETIIVSHDETLDRCTNKSGRLADICKEDLKNIDAGSWFSDKYIGERIPTIHELISLVNELGLNVNIEIKSSSISAELSETLIDNLIDALKAISPSCELIVSSFNHLVLSEFKKKSPETKVACLFESHHLYDDWRSILEWCQADYIHPEHKGLTKQMVQDFKNFGAKVNVWTVNDLSRANELFNWGVDGICTDIAEKFPSYYRCKG